MPSRRGSQQLEGPQNRAEDTEELHGRRSDLTPPVSAPEAQPQRVLGIYDQRMTASGHALHVSEECLG
eukprot:3724-Eustigmatos_ZCMA.PRE.1